MLGSSKVRQAGELGLEAEWIGSQEDDIILMAPNPSSLQTQLTSLADFAGAEHLRVSKEKTLVLLEKCTGKVHLDAIELQEKMESKCLGNI